MVAGALLGVPVRKPRDFSWVVTWVASWSRLAPLSTTTTTALGAGSPSAWPPGVQVSGAAELGGAAVLDEASGRCSTRHHTMAVSTLNTSRKTNAGRGRRAVETDMLARY